jgi:tRNA(fMet)-specific endonuclease VapC
MSKTFYMLDTNTCSFLIRNKPIYLFEKLQQVVATGHPVVISAITYAELRFGAINKKASPKMPGIVTEFVERLDAVLPWDKKAVEMSSHIKQQLESQGVPIGHNDILIAGHCLSIGAVLVTDNVQEFKRVDSLSVENWVHR